MNITADEKQMYQVMKALYESGIPICFKGSMVLKACLNEAGYVDEVRRTVDIDANWNSEEPPTAEQLVSSLQSVLDRNNLQIDVQMFRMYAEDRSAGFMLTDRTTGAELFSIDMDVNRPMPETRLYEIAGLSFRGVSPTQMIADKVSAVSSNKVFRRVKDVIDLYYISKAFPFPKEAVLQALKNGGRTLDSFDGFLKRQDELRHAYDKFRVGEDVEKPPFEEVYLTVKKYIKGVLPRERKHEHQL